jgi:hypothetical protein
MNRASQIEEMSDMLMDAYGIIDEFLAERDATYTKR